MADSNPFANLNFEDFRRMARDMSLSQYERIGFPDSYRAGHEINIFADIRAKLTSLEGNGRTVLDIGPGCSDLPRLLIDLCRQRGHELYLVDCQEMLDQLPQAPFVHQITGLFPNCPDFIAAQQEKIDAILCYSVLHYVMVDVAFFRFIDVCLSLLAPGGQLLIGDIPNISKRKRFFSSAAGARFHQQFMNTDQLPVVEHNRVELDQIDDAVVMSIVQRSRLAGFDAYILPQRTDLPMANRREDILIIRP